MVLYKKGYILFLYNVSIKLIVQKLFRIEHFKRPQFIYNTWYYILEKFVFHVNQYDEQTYKIRVYMLHRYKDKVFLFNMQTDSAMQKAKLDFRLYIIKLFHHTSLKTLLRNWFITNIFIIKIKKEVESFARWSFSVKLCLFKVFGLSDRNNNLTLYGSSFNKKDCRRTNTTRDCQLTH